MNDIDKLKQIIYNHIHVGLTTNGNRGTSRTTQLHEGIFNIIKQYIKNFDDKYIVEYEVPIECTYGNKFKIDVVIKDKVKNQIVVCILLKAFISSVQKNRANGANTTRGEIFRIKGVPNRSNVKIWFITLLANTIANYRNDGRLRNMENSKKAYVDMAAIETENNVFHSTIFYNLNQIDYTTKETFKNTLLETNISDITIDNLTKKISNIL